MSNITIRPMEPEDWEVVSAGTFLNGLMHVGRKMVEGGRCAEPAVHNFTESITRWGITTDRMKTGTPVRIDKRSVHFEDMEEQPGDSDFHQFSYMGRTSGSETIALLDLLHQQEGTRNFKKRSR